MKKTYHLFFIAFLLLFSCQDDENTAIDPELVGTWKLAERLLDPGDGSGKFEPVESDMTLDFLTNNILKVANGNLCNFEINTEEESIMTYSLEQNQINPNCSDQFFIGFEIQETFLFLSFPCIEGCGYKFTKL